MKSNITKMITMCMCMMVAGFASEDKQSIHVEKELTAIPAQQQINDQKNVDYSVKKRMEVIKKSLKKHAQVQNPSESRDMKRIKEMMQNQVYA